QWIIAWNSWDDLHGSIGNDSDILFSRSLDNGVTWSGAAPLNTNAGTDHGGDEGVTLATDGKGQWIAAWSTTENIEGRIGTDGDMAFATSDDNGATWSPPRVLNRFAASDQNLDGMARLGTDGKGKWVICWESQFDGVGAGKEPPIAILTAQSVDNGRSWIDERPLVGAYRPAEAGDDRMPSIATNGHGIWTLVWEATSDSIGKGADADILFSRSVDDGMTWSAPSAVNHYAFSDHGDDLSPRVTTDGHGRWLCTWSSLEDFDGAKGNDA